MGSHNYMSIHAVTRACHNIDGLVRFTGGANGMSGQIIGILKSDTKEHEAIVYEGLVLDDILLDRVFKAPITTVNSIHHSFCIAFSQVLKTIPNKVITQPRSIES